jgi:hypothetical protein
MNMKFARLNFGGLSMSRNPAATTSGLFSKVLR